MSRTFLTIAAISLLGFTLSGCGWFDRVTASTTGWSRICVGGVSYLQFTSGASVEYTSDGKVKTCN